MFLSNSFACPASAAVKKGTREKNLKFWVGQSYPISIAGFNKYNVTMDSPVLRLSKSMFQYNSK